MQVGALLVRALLHGRIEILGDLLRENAVRHCLEAFLRLIERLARRVTIDGRRSIVFRLVTRVHTGMDLLLGVQVAHLFDVRAHPNKLIGIARLERILKEINRVPIHHLILEKVQAVHGRNKCKVVASFRRFLLKDDPQVRIRLLLANAIIRSHLDRQC